MSRRINYSKLGSDTGFSKVPRDLIPAPTHFNRLPFAHMNSSGWGYHTLLVEPPIFLNRLRNDLRLQVPFKLRRFRSFADVAQLSQPVVVNCTGLGAGQIFGDPAVVPIKGHLVLVKAQPHLDYLYSSGETYVFPREDHVVVGGSYEPDPDDDKVDEVIIQKILRLARNTFAGATLAADEREPWMLPRSVYGGDSALFRRGLRHRTADAAERRGAVRGARRLRRGAVRGRGPREHPGPAVPDRRQQQRPRIRLRRRRLRAGSRPVRGIGVLRRRHV